LAAICKTEKVPADSDALYRIARAAAGSMRDSLSLLDQLLAGADKVTDDEVIRILGTPPDERVMAIVTAVADGNSAAALNELAAILDGGITFASLLGAMGDVYRNMMLAVTCGPTSDLIELPETRKKQLAELASRFSLPVIVQSVGILQNVARNIRGSSVSRALVEAAIVRLAEADKFIDPQSIVARLEQLAAGGMAMTVDAKKKI
ncbi:MAG TPA: hypothetical protein PKK48_04060, partial [Phycisphaerae bacterium]|nr:hypothetical protein [Phycisphaerae bacterium]